MDDVDYELAQLEAAQSIQNHGQQGANNDSAPSGGWQAGGEISQRNDTSAATDAPADYLNIDLNGAGRGGSGEFGNADEESYGVGTGSTGDERMMGIQIANSNGGIMGDYLNSQSLNLNEAFSMFGDSKHSANGTEALESFLQNYHQECMRHAPQERRQASSAPQRRQRSRRNAQNAAAGALDDEDDDDDDDPQNVDSMRDRLLKRMQQRAQRNERDAAAAAGGQQDDGSAEQGAEGSDEDDSGDSLDSDDSATENSADARMRSTVAGMLNAQSRQHQQEAVEQYRAMLSRANIDPEYYLENFCPLCGFSDNSMDPVVNDDWHAIKNLIDSSVTHISERTHAIIVSLFWTERIYLPMRKQNKRCLPLTVDMALDHIYSPHKLDMRVIQSQAVRDMKKVSTVVKNHIFSRHPITGNLEVNTKNVEKYLQVNQALFRTAGMDPAKTPFNSQQDTDVAKNAGASVTPLRSLKRANPAAAIPRSNKRGRAS